MASKTSFYNNSGITNTQINAIDTAVTNAASSATAAALSQSNAAASSASASSSEITVEQHKDDSLASSLASASSASTASTKASEAAASAVASEVSRVASASSASSILGAVTNSANSATAAATSATDADTAKTASESARDTAQGYLSTVQADAATATTKASEANTSATNAASSETNAATSASNASTSASNASTSETNASTSETNAATSATNASTSETNAATSETNAETAKTDAETAKNAAETALDEFTDLYLGSKSSSPAVDNDNNALIVGSMYFDTTGNLMKVYNGTLWVNAGSSVNGTVERQSYTATAGQTTFNVTYDVGFVDLWLNGIKLLANTDFTATNGTSIVLTIGASVDDVVDIVAYGTFELANTLPLTGGTFTGDIGITSANPILTIRDTETGVSASNARLRLAESGAGSSLDNYFDVGFVADKFTISSNSVADALTIARDTGNVGIGIDSPTQKLDITTAGTTRAFIRNTNLTSSGMYIGEDSAGQQILGLGAYPMKFGTNGSEALRITSGGVMLVGKASVDNTTVGFRFDGSSGFASFVRDGGEPLYLNRNTSFGEIVKFAKGGATKGSIKIPATDNFSFIGENGNATIGAGDTGLIISSGESIRPFNPSTNSSRTNAIGLGESYAKFTDVWATDGSINTSDGNEKQDIASLTATEMLVAKRISALFKTFKWKDAVAKKGNDARTHTGVIAQELQAAFTAEGLDAGDYAMFMSDTWWETQTEVPAVEAGEDVEAKDAYTRTDIYDTEAEAPEGATSKTILGIRYHELLSFVGAYNEQRFASIEARITALEA